MAAIAGSLHAPAGKRLSALGLAVVLAALALCVPLARGYFLADDFVQLANFGHWDATGRLAAEVASRFAGSIDGVNAFYRPLTFASFAVNYRIAGAHAPAWLAVNLALHVANAVLVGALVTRLAGERTRAAIVGALAAGMLFFVFSPGWEVALWIACRYDSLATFFTLLAAVGFLRGRVLAALAATLAALLSKESGAVAIVAILLLAPLRPAPRDGNALVGWLRAVGPWIALGAAYTLLRIAIFGSAFHVYRDLHVDLASAAHWREMLASAGVWGRDLFPGVPGVRGLLAASLAVIGLGLALAAARDRRALLRQVLVLALLAAACLLLLPHLGEFDTHGLGGRLFYQASAFYAIAIGLAVHEAALGLAERPLASAVAVCAAAFLLSVNAMWGWKAAAEYRTAQRSMRAAAEALAGLARRRSASDYFVVLVPDALGRVPFGRNAQAGLMLPPVQRAPLSNVLLVQTDREIRGLDRTIDGGTLAVLRAHSLFDLLEGRVGPGPWRRELPTRWYCWNAWRRTMAPLEIVAAPGRIGPAAGREYAQACGADAPDG